MIGIMLPMIWKKGQIWKDESYGFSILILQIGDYINKYKLHVIVFDDLHLKQL